MAYDRIQSHTVVSVSDSEDEAEHLDDALFICVDVCLFLDDVFEMARFPTNE